ncbi:Rhomboid-related protein 3 [Operophtera brumata]|uniref:Rhomboid-related protein 3 n=1 Tax=Operophtera brumata TaxID=104452 RepID=A0A0L7LK18_OPEBR|nr:Rhomboid-related protein 3 [Operophtera brumata]
MSRQNETSVSMPMRQIGSDQYWRGIFNKYFRFYFLEHALVQDKSLGNDSRYLDFKEFIEMMHNPDLKAVFGHFVGRYIHSIIPHRNPVDTTARVYTRSKSVFTYSDGTYEEEYSCWPPAVCMILISLVEIVLFCYDAAHGSTQAQGPIAQLFLGVPLEMVHRWWRVTLVYLAGVAAGSLATSLTDPKVYLAGASGGNWSEMEFAIIQLLVFLLLAGVDVGTAVYDRYWRHLEQNIGYVAHLAGALAGLLVGIGVLRNLEKRKWEKRLWWAAVVLYFSLMIAGILANIFWTERFNIAPAKTP